MTERLAVCGEQTVFRQRFQCDMIKRPGRRYQRQTEPNRNGSHEDRVMAKRQLPSPEALRQLLRYDPETGKLFWRDRHDMGPQWNGRYAGAEALGAVCKKDGYKRGNLGRSSLRAHRVIWAICHGS